MNGKQYETREERTAKLYNEAPPAEPAHTTRVSTLVIKTVEKDVRKLLDFMDAQYTNDELRSAMQRLRKWVGYL